MWLDTWIPGSDTEQMEQMDRGDFTGVVVLTSSFFISVMIWYFFGTFSWNGLWSVDTSLKIPWEKGWVCEKSNSEVETKVV